MTQQTHSKVYTLENWQHKYTEKCVQIFIVALFIIDKKWKPKYPLTNGWMKCAMEYYLAIKRNEVCYNMDDTWKH